MYIVAIHDIEEPATFWQTVRTAPIPEGVVLHSTLPNPDGSRAVCLWHAESLEAIEALVEATVGSISTNSYFEVATENALGLPA